MQIEIAYDALLMRSMKARLSGELRPSRDVQFADVRKYRPAAPRVGYSTPSSLLMPLLPDNPFLPFKPSGSINYDGTD